MPARLAGLVRGYTRGEPLRPIARISTRRQVVTLIDNAGASLAEIAADDVSAQTLGEETMISQWAEVEVELTGGSPRLLKAADAQLPPGRAAALRAGREAGTGAGLVGFRGLPGRRERAWQAAARRAASVRR